MGTRIFKIDEDMSEIIDAKVGNRQISTSKKWANLSQPWNLAFLQDYFKIDKDMSEIIDAKVGNP